MTDRVGQQIGNYRLLQVLGEGGFAEVYLGEHLYLGSQAAIKLLHTRVAANDIAQFQQEGRMLANLMHPAIVRVLDFGIDNHNPYLIMDYAPGGTLRSRHPRGSRVPLPIVVQYAKQIGQALQHAHDQRLIHRDVKPENMLIGRHNEILLSDFGIALIAQSSRYQSTKDMAGTIAYMAPEQIEAHPRPASDQYSLAVVVYEWLSGERPFRGTFTEIAIKHSVTPPSPLISHLPSLPPAVEKVIFTALAKKPEERFGSIRAFVNALEQASQDSQTQPPKSTSSISLPTLSSSLPSPISQAELPSVPPPPPPDAPTPAQPQTVSSHLPAQHETQLAVPPTSSALPTPHTHISTPMTPIPPIAPPSPTPKLRRSTIAIRWFELLPIRVGLALVLLAIGGGVFASFSYTSYIHTLSVSATDTAQAQATAAFIQSEQNLFNTTTAKKPVVQGFQNNKLQWETDPRGCDLVNDTYHARIVVPGFYRTCMAAKSNFKNFAYQVTLAIPEGNAGGVIFRDDAKGNYYRAWITNTSDGPSNFFVSYCDSVTFICQDFQTIDGDPLTSSKVTLHPGMLVTLTVIAKDSNINLYVNGLLSISLVVDGNHKVVPIPPIAGQIGFYAASENVQNPATDVAFTNLRVWSLD